MAITRSKKASASASWRDILPIHPAAEVFPRISSDELRTLGEDIKRNGLTSPIVLWRADPKGQAQLLDGRNRLDGIEIATGCPVEIGPPSLAAGEFLALDKVIVLDKSVDPYAYVISANLHRRHLTVEQKRELIGTLLAADPSKSDRQVAKQVKASPTFVGKVRAEKEAAGDVSTVDTRRDTKGRRQPAKKARPTNTSSSGGEIARKLARLEELEAENTRLRRENVALRSEIDELKARLAAVPPPDDGFDIPEFLRRSAS